MGRAGAICDFSGKIGHFNDWAFRFKCHIAGLYEKSEEILEWAASQPGEITAMDITQHSNHQAAEISEGIYYLVTRHTHGEALELAKLVPRNNGAELWRKISRRYDPRTSVKRAALLNTIIQQKAVQIEDLGHTLDKWMAKAKTYEDRTNTKLPDGLRMTIIQNMCPETLMLHLELNSARLTTSEQMIAEIRANLESRQPQAMEVDSHEKHEGYEVDSFGQKGKGKGKGKGCLNCAGPHLARDCPQSQKGKGK